MKKYSEMTIAEFVRALNVRRVGEDKIGCYTPKYGRDEILAYMRANKPAILQYLMEQEAERARAEQAAAKARAEREAKIQAIPGLAEIEHARADLDAWHDEWNASFEGPNACGGLGVRRRPEYDFAALNQQYPRAAAYIKAQAYSYAAHPAKSSAGKIALEKIINGEDYNAAIAEMEAAWTKYCDDHIWD